MPNEITPEQIAEWKGRREADACYIEGTGGRTVTYHWLERFRIVCDAYESLLAAHTPPPDLQGTAKLAQVVLADKLSDWEKSQLAAGYLALYAAAPKSAERIAKLEREVERLSNELNDARNELLGIQMAPHVKEFLDGMEASERTSHDTGN